MTFSPRRHATAIAGTVLLAVVALGCSPTATAGPSSASATPQAIPTATPTARLAATPSSAATPQPTVTAAVPTPTPVFGFAATGNPGAVDKTTLTLLQDGRVLMAGGVDGPLHALASAQLYDPKSGAFTATGSLLTARADATATLLSDGKVLVAGGKVDASIYTGGPKTAGLPVASAELYDPTSGTFSATGSMLNARTGATATLISGGRVLVVGGASGAEVYDPGSGKFTAAGKMIATRYYGATASLLPDGRVLVVGGSGKTGALASAEIYDPGTNKFTATGSMHSARVYHSATTLSDGRILIAGGCSSGQVGSAALATAEIYDPKTQKFSLTGSMTSRRAYQGAALLGDGRVIVGGGSPAFGHLQGIPNGELFDAKTGTFHAAGALTERHWTMQAVSLPDGRALFVGGMWGAEVFGPLRAG